MKHLRGIALASVAVLIAAASVLPIASAATETDRVSSSALGIAPKKQYEIEPGKSVDDKLTIRNIDNSAPLELTLRVVDFTYDSSQDSGVAKFFLDQNAEKTPWSLRSYMSVPQTVTIAPGETKSVDISIAIPQEQGAGSLYSAIVYSSGSGGTNGSTNVGLSASGVTLVFANVPGKVHEDLRLEKLGPYDKIAKQYMPYITTAMPQSIGYTLKNSGNWAEAPVGSITVKGWFGRSMVIENINPAKSLVLIGQTRTFSSCIKYDEKEVANTRSNTSPTTCVDPGLWPGHYSVTANLFYGANGNETRELVKTVGFWYLPLWFIIALIIVLLIAAWHIRKFVRAIRRKRNGGVKFGRTPKRRR